ncbi:L-ribulose-5-phosphate 3-epimerase [Parabacteroides sp. PF5-5]|uniref:sugar phosphate isomerase/epimerase family protein n=1 Tax=unclassified Parabacteroides TaxID=2649774 RepID=UPI0024740FED|nr:MULTISPECIES: sugar phosphate isomerase/epimerase [unclassified Parabacteroides]MDH6305435.1 L-ribulose-5-phosphate 3-epimerase [Parabacteroides sp. PH5-39]MDH6316145.1 L-ribulose-5-phosphate 3-epimerase [Parabacteroides sp. PF5-13]MDH6320295.1 L-ribulose-5-phosphate 3-epimerase [Parabacteroides sp. PH5-13]MDH6324025.1 L-ribulose-5-phosphate 3-epimerase [Parabacteroides sp. PH5-8]MDH6327336.1 L-ribulose-5-phosphate 3-epimerase [Parabacteroides sp. PH5-41]
MKQLQLLFVLSLLLGATACGSKTKQSEKESVTSKWKVGIQTYTFHKFTLMEALDKSKDLGLHYAEAYFTQELGKGFTEGDWLREDLPAEDRKRLLDEFAKRGIKLYSFGVAFYDTTEDWEKFFRFSKDMGIHTVTAEPRLEHLDFVEQLALKYGIEVAIHNHPSPSVYADPDVLLKALEGRDPIIGVCADIGHWKRTNNDPVETLKKFKGRVKVVHLKDLSREMDDTTWGTGILPVKEVIEEMKAQQFSGLISVEYENYGDSQLDDIKKSLEYYNLLIK